MSQQEIISASFVSMVINKLEMPIPEKLRLLKFTAWTIRSSNVDNLLYLECLHAIKELSGNAKA